jgi:GTP-binding protein EngB required for normal cell division
MLPMQAMLETVYSEWDQLLESLEQGEPAIDLSSFRAATSQPSTPPPQRWVLLGEVSAGKSTLLNTLIDKSCLPVGHLSTTAAAIRICLPTEESPNETVWLHPYRRNDYEQMLEWLLGKLPGDDVDSIQPCLERACWVLEQTQFQDEKRLVIQGIERVLACLNTIEQKDPSPIRIALDQLDSYVTANTLQWREICVHLNTKWSDLPIEWIDTPGFGHHDLLHRWIAEQSLHQADRALFLVEPKGASQESLDFLLQLSDKQRTEFVLLFSRIDQFGDEDNPFAWKDAAQRVREQLQWRGLWFGVSTLCAQFSREAQQHELSSRQRRQFEKVAMQPEPLDPGRNLKLSGLEAFEKKFIRKQVTSHLHAYLSGTAAALELKALNLQQALEAQLRNAETSREQAWLEFISQKAALTEARMLQLDQSYDETRDALLSEQVIWFSNVQKSVHREERRTRLLFRQLKESVHRKLCLKQLVSFWHRDLLSPAQILMINLRVWLGLKGWLPYRLKTYCPWRVNLQQTRSLSSETDRTWHANFFAHSQVWQTDMPVESQWPTGIGQPHKVRQEGLAYVSSILEQQARLDQRTSLQLEQDFKPSSNKLRTSAQQDMVRWRRLLRKRSTFLFDHQLKADLHQYHLELNELQDSIRESGRPSKALANVDPLRQSLLEIASFRSQVNLIRITLGNKNLWS